NADAESRPTLEMLDVRHASGGEIVERDGLIPAVEQSLAEMRSDESGATGDEKFHLHVGSPRPHMLRPSYRLPQTMCPHHVPKRPMTFPTFPISHAIPVNGSRRHDAVIGRNQD